MPWCILPFPNISPDTFRALTTNLSHAMADCGWLRIPRGISGGNVSQQSPKECLEIIYIKVIQDWKLNNNIYNICSFIHHRSLPIRRLETYFPIGKGTFQGLFSTLGSRNFRFEYIMMPFVQSVLERFRKYVCQDREGVNGDMAKNHVNFTCFFSGEPRITKPRGIRSNTGWLSDRVN